MTSSQAVGLRTAPIRRRRGWLRGRTRTRQITGAETILLTQVGEQRTLPRGLTEPKMPVAHQRWF